MKQLAIILPDGATTLSSLILTVEVIEAANQYFVGRGKRAVFKTTLVGRSKEGFVSKGAFRVIADKTLEEFDQADLVIVPSLGEDTQNAIKQNQQNMAWVHSQYKKGAEVASLCTGAFLLASAGLLDGRQCSTHWATANTFRFMFPKVGLAIEKIITYEHGIYTTGGALSSLNLVLYIVERYYDRETAIYIAKVFEIDLERNSQAPFVIFSGQKHHKDEEIEKAQLFIENNIGEKIIVENLSARFSIDRRNFDRRFKKATGNTPLEYMQRAKVEAAKKYLETSRKSVNEVMFDVGYTDVKAFREVFRKITGLSPLEYRGKYNKEATA